MNSETESEEFLDGVLKLEDLPKDAQEMWNRWKKEEKQIDLMVKKWSNEKLDKEEKIKNERRDKDFERAMYCLQRSGYQGKHGHFVVPQEEMAKAFEMYDFVKNADEENWSEDDWKNKSVFSRIEIQQTFIRRVNEIIVKYGWNPEDEQ